MEEYQEIELPEGAKILTAQVQYGLPTIWAEVDTMKKQTTRKFGIIPTGGTIGYKKYHYITTLQFNGGKFVQHVYEYLDA